MYSLRLLCLSLRLPSEHCCDFLFQRTTVFFTCHPRNSGLKIQCFMPCNLSRIKEQIHLIIYLRENLQLKKYGILWELLF